MRKTTKGQYKVFNDPIVIRDACNYYIQCKSLSQTAKKFDVKVPTLRNRLLQNNIDTTLDKEAQSLRMVKYPIDRDYFEKIDTRDKAYILGLLFSDGYVSSSRKQVRLRLTDIDLLEEVREALNYTKPLNVCKKDKIHHKQSKELIICNKKIYEDILDLGITANKSYDCKFPQDI